MHHVLDARDGPEVRSLLQERIPILDFIAAGVDDDQGLAGELREVTDGDELVVVQADERAPALRVPMPSEVSQLEVDLDRSPLPVDEARGLERLDFTVVSGPALVRLQEGDDAALVDPNAAHAALARDCLGADDIGPASGRHGGTPSGGA